MRISDWSSDVCSSDLLHRLVILEIGLQCHRGRDAVALDQRHRLREDAPVQRLEEMHAIELYRQVIDDRSEESGVGNEGVSTRRSRWSPEHTKKNNHRYKIANNRHRNTKITQFT